MSKWRNRPTEASIPPPCDPVAPSPWEGQNGMVDGTESERGGDEGIRKHANTEMRHLLALEEC